MSIITGGADTRHLVSLNGMDALVEQSGHYVDPLHWRRGIQGVGELGELGVIPLTRGLRGLMHDAAVTRALPVNPVHPALNGLGCDSCSDVATTGTTDRNAVLDLVCRCGPAQADSALPAAANPLAQAAVSPILTSAFGLGGLAACHAGMGLQCRADTFPEVISVGLTPLGWGAVALAALLLFKWGHK